MEKHKKKKLQINVKPSQKFDLVTNLRHKLTSNRKKKKKGLQLDLTWCILQVTAMLCNSTDSISVPKGCRNMYQDNILNKTCHAEILRNIFDKKDLDYVF